MNKRDSKERIALQIQLFGEGSSFADRTELHVVPTGEWKHPVYGNMEITPDDIAEFVENFKTGPRNELPITAGHDNGMSGGELPAIGWFKELYDRGVNGLWAVVQWTDQGKELLANEAFKYFSPEFYENYTDPETGNEYGHMLVGGALTNKPYFKELTAPVPAFSFSEDKDGVIQFNDQQMNLNDILAKKPEELSADEKVFVREHQADLSDEQKTSFAAALEDGSGEGGEGDGGDEGAAGSDKGDGGADAGKVDMSEKNKGKMIQMSEAELKALRAKADEGAKAFAEVEKMKLNAEVDKLVFSAANTEGRILPKQKEAVVALMFSLNAKQRDQFRNIVNALPKAANIFAEIGDGGATESTAAKEVETKVQEKIKASEGKLIYSAALKAVFTENPDLAKRYEEENPAA